MSEPWQNIINTWKSKCSYLHGKEYMSDCCFILENTNIKIPAHKFVLASCSTTFYYLFFISKNINEITVRNVSLEALESFVFFLYNETTTLKLNTLWDILKIAKIYSVKSLERLCDDSLLKILNPDNFSDHLEKLTKFNLPKCEAKCCNFLNTTKVSFETLEKILNLKCFAGNNTKMYKAINKWSEDCCKNYDCSVTAENKRFFLGENFEKYLELIQFERISVNEFYEFTVGHDLMLTSHEIYDIYKNISMDSKVNSNKNHARKKEKAKATSKNLRLNKLFCEVNQIIEECSDELETVAIPSTEILNTSKYLVALADHNSSRQFDLEDLTSREIERSINKKSFYNFNSTEGFSEAKQIIKECKDIIKRRKQKSGTNSRSKKLFSTVYKIIEECPTNKPEEIEIMPKESIIDNISEKNFITGMKSSRKAPLCILEPHEKDSKYLERKEKISNNTRKSIELTVKNEYVLKIESTSETIIQNKSTQHNQVQFDKIKVRKIKKEDLTDLKPKTKIKNNTNFTAIMCKAENSVNTKSESFAIRNVKKEESAHSRSYLEAFFPNKITSDFETPRRSVEYNYKGCGCKVSCSGNCGCYKSGSVCSPSCFCRGDCSSLSRPSPQSLLKMEVSSIHLPVDYLNSRSSSIGSFIQSNRSCGCKVSCSGNCGCYKSGNVCSSSCFCRGDCSSLSRPSPQSLDKMAGRLSHQPEFLESKSISSPQCLMRLSHSLSSTSSYDYCSSMKNTRSVSVRCGCKISCTGRCTCSRNNVSCNSSCACGGRCY